MPDDTMNNKRMFKYEFNHPYCSCYTRQDLIRMASTSKSLSFNEDRFLSHARWMGIHFYTNDQDELNALEDQYFVVNKRELGNRIGTAWDDGNNDPFFYKFENEVFYTKQAIFAGRGYHKRSEAINLVCDGSCLICEKKRFDEDDDFDTGVVFSFDGERFELLCRDCFCDFWRRSRDPECDVPWMNYMGLSGGGLISFTRFVSKKYQDTRVLEACDERVPPGHRG